MNMNYERIQDSRKKIAYMMEIIQYVEEGYNIEKKKDTN